MYSRDVVALLLKRQPPPERAPCDALQSFLKDVLDAGDRSFPLLSLGREPPAPIPWWGLSAALQGWLVRL